MNDYAVVVLADSDTPGGRGRMVHALKTAQALREGGADVGIHFHGVGVTWLEVFDVREHPFAQHYGPAFDKVQDLMVGACNFCTNGRFDMSEHAKSLGVPIEGPEGEHHTIAELVLSGTQILSF
jgi:DNA-binding transcriptional LysR family regulator